MNAIAERPLVLLLDDQQEILSLLEKLLGHHGYAVVARTSGQALLDECRASVAAGHRPGAAILDLTLPDGLTGEETATQLQAIVPGLPCLAMSGLSRRDGPDDEYSPFCGFITKPFSFDGVLETVHSCFDSPAAPDEC